MAIVAGRAPAPDAPRAEWVAWASRRVSIAETGVEPIRVIGGPLQNVERPSDPTTSDGRVIVVEEAIGPDDRADGRLCAEPGCITKLSKYNIASRCFAHDRGPF